MSRPSPSGSPAPQGNGSTSPAPGSKARQSMGPSVRPAGLAPLSPRPQGSAVRPTSELLGNSTSFQTPESEAIDQWFENLQNYEATLEEMAAASLDVNFKEELSAIEQWFRVLSEAERTAALYSLLQHSTQVQIRFFITVLQQMARSDPMTALLSPGMGGSMQAQMEAKLLSMGLKSPGLKAPASPSARNFSGNTPSSNFLTPDAALASPAPDAAATLAQQRARLKASNVDAASRRISAPPTTLSNSDGRNVWQPPQLGQVAERAPSPNNGSNGRIALADARAFRRTSRGSAQSPDTSTGAFDDNNLTVPTSSSTRGQTTKSPGGPNPMMNQMWPGMQARSPALSNASSNRFATQEEQLAAAAAAAAAAGMPFGMGMAGSPNMQLAMSPLMGGMGGFNMMNLGMGMDPLQAQFIAAQIASGQFGAQFAGLQNAQMMMGRGARPNQRGGKPPSSNGREGKEKSEEDFDPALLTDIPAWLRSLRLHKYTPNFEGMTWKDMVIMDEAALEAKGVAALGARRKMLKTFEVVRSKMGITMPGEEA
ncbi:hypothetical protein FRC16_008657 [Serendipita sp. 398]|nr:hypothetical protein FRC16_008657 [Serendipita sp. 398]